MYKSVQISEFLAPRAYSSDQVKEYKKKVKEKTEKYSELLKDYFLTSEKEKVILDAKKIQEALFPEGDQSDIFLSHSHQDEDSVIQLAMYLEEEFELKVFIDSCIWGDVYALLKKIDDKFCQNDSGETYSYQKRNHSTANLYMILNTALHSKINSSELFLFLGTNSSVSIIDAISSVDKDATSLSEEYIKSPWIYSELEFASKVAISVPDRVQLKQGFGLEAHSEEIKVLNESISFYYPIPSMQSGMKGDDFNRFLQKMRSKDISKYDFLDSFYAVLPKERTMVGS